MIIKYYHVHSLINMQIDEYTCTLVVGSTNKILKEPQQDVLFHSRFSVVEERSDTLMEIRTVASGANYSCPIKETA